MYFLCRWNCFPVYCFSQMGPHLFFSSIVFHMGPPTLSVWPELPDFVQKLWRTNAIELNSKPFAVLAVRNIAISVSGQQCLLLRRQMLWLQFHGFIGQTGLIFFEQYKSKPFIVALAGKSSRAILVHVILRNYLKGQIEFQSLTYQ